MCEVTTNSQPEWQKNAGPDDAITVFGSGGISAWAVWASGKDT